MKGLNRVSTFHNTHSLDSKEGRTLKQRNKQKVPDVGTFCFILRSVFDEPETIFAIHNAKIVEAEQEVLSERSEVRNLTLKDTEIDE